MQGIVKWFDVKKGFGFIASDGKDYFVHYKEVKTNQNFKTLNQGDLVTFEYDAAPKGPVARKVQLCETPY